ncbi:unnamed protein product [Leptidea sinapis]|uniref:Uncharacterized protein n=1 Tax=Leptidea sinapis TaxID=189913 RepID=A0A5E4QBU5_9NEOP|nr:unnamed protein product [Leptidea sinapis]
MNRMEDSVLSPSYFWSCLTLGEECPFISSADPKLYYFALVLTALYAVLLLTILTEVMFYLPLDNFQNQIDYYINCVKKKISRVQANQRRLVTVQERAGKQLQRSMHCCNLVCLLRNDLTIEPDKVKPYTTNAENVDSSEYYKIDENM